MTTPHDSPILAALEPCPFCGHGANVIEGGDGYYVACDSVNCGCALGEQYDRDAMPEHWFFDVDTARVAWNQRTALAAYRESGWRPIESAPRDGTEIHARIPGHGEDNIIAWHDGFIGGENGENDVGAWVFVAEQEPPDSWTEGVCWEVNEDGEPSVKPTHWKPTPPEELK